jgi:hypothetical protein
MAFEVNISPEHELGVIRLTAQVDGNALLEALDVLYNGNTWAPCFHAIWDMRHVEELSVVPAEADRIIERMEELCHRVGTGRTAVIAPREVDALFFRMLFARTACVARERKIMHDLDGVLAWLSEVYAPSGAGLRHAVSNLVEPASSRPCRGRPGVQGATAKDA